MLAICGWLTINVEVGLCVAAFVLTCAGKDPAGFNCQSGEYLLTTQPEKTVSITRLRTVALIKAGLLQLWGVLWSWVSSSGNG